MSHELQQKLLDALDKIDRPGLFCCSGDAPPVLPGLDVEGLGQIGLPLSKAQAAELRGLCRQAPYGKGEQTLIDTDVRRVWQLDADRFKLRNPEWKTFLDETIAVVQAELGLENEKLQAHLYNLLLYEKGSFFKSHRDGEKLDRMVATLVVELPSSHEGGELVVRHDGQEQVLGQEGGNPFRLRFFAFYADCEHEIRPVRSGFRLCLVYNLTLAKSKSKAGIAAPQNSEHVAELARLLSGWKADSPKKLAVLLDHQYTPEGLAFDALKGVDRAKAKALFEAAARSSLQAHLALITLWQSGSAEEEYSDYGRYRRHRYYERDDETDGGSSSHTMGEIYDTSLTAENWSDAQGRAIPFGAIRIEQSEVLPADALTDVDPEEDFEGYTGNEGMTLERWYRHAAIVLWPDARHFDVLCDAGIQAAFAGLEQMVAEGRKSGKKHWLEVVRPRCLEFAGSIVARWPDRQHNYGAKDDSPEQHALAVFADLGDAALAASFLQGPMRRDVGLRSSGALRKLCNEHGWRRFEKELGPLLGETTRSTIERNAEMLEELCLADDESADHRDLCRSLATRMLPAFEQLDRKPGTTWQIDRWDRPAVLTSLVKSLVSVDEPDLLGKYIEHVLGSPREFPLTDVQVPALLSVGPWIIERPRTAAAPVIAWLAACRDELQARVDNPPQEPGDWRRPAKLSCTCQLCRELAQFLDDPDEQVHRFRVKKELRRHLHGIIAGNNCDLDHQTDRSGSPQTLVCTKNKASYHKALKAHDVDVAQLKSIRELLDRVGG